MLCAILAMLSTAATVLGATPTSGRVYLACAFGTRFVYHTDYSFDGVTLAADPVVTITTLPTAADVLLAPDGDLIVGGQGVFCGGCIYKVNVTTGIAESRNAGNNNNALAIDPTGTIVYAGWIGTNPSEVPIAPFADGVVRAVTGDEPTITSLAFTPSHGAFYTTGGGGAGDFGQLTLGATYTTDRTLTNEPATSVHYDPFSESLIVSGGGMCIQVDPANPGVILSSRNDAPTENYIELQPDGRGHLIGNRNVGDGALVLIDYSASGLIGDSSTVLAVAALPGVTGLSGGVALAPSCVGDINNDGSTNAADFVILAGSFGASVTPNTNGDLNGDGLVNASDFVILAGDFGCGG
jgi:hypothetical protein